MNHCYYPMNISQYYNNISLTPLIAPKQQTSSFFYMEASSPMQHVFMSLVEATASFSNAKAKIRHAIPCQRVSKGGLTARFPADNPTEGWSLMSYLFGSMPISLLHLAFNAVQSTRCAPELRVVTRQIQRPSPYFSCQYSLLCI